jgi:hypothetical protein
MDWAHESNEIAKCDINVTSSIICYEGNFTLAMHNASVLVVRNARGFSKLISWS